MSPVIIGLAGVGALYFLNEADRALDGWISDRMEAFLVCIAGLSVLGAIALRFLTP